MVALNSTDLSGMAALHSVSGGTGAAGPIPVAAKAGCSHSSGECRTLSSDCFEKSKSSQNRAEVVKIFTEGFRAILRQPAATEEEKSLAQTGLTLAGDLSDPYLISDAQSVLMSSLASLATHSRKDL